jgi:nitrate reductase cytochrome c-type subunit
MFKRCSKCSRFKIINNTMVCLTKFSSDGEKTYEEIKKKRKFCLKSHVKIIPLKEDENT